MQGSVFQKAPPSLLGSQVNKGETLSSDMASPCSGHLSPTGLPPPAVTTPGETRERMSEEVGAVVQKVGGGGSQLRALPPSSFLLLLSLALLGVGTDTQPPLFWSHL